MEIIARHFPKLKSTNSWALDHCEELPREKVTLVSTAEQTAGRGRLDRQWKSGSEENIAATFCFFLDEGRKDLGCLTQLLALAAAELLEARGIAALIKWPNDLLIEEAKIGGILCETRPCREKRFIALGIGLNVNMPQEELSKIDRPAASLRAALGEAQNIETIQNELGGRFVDKLELFAEKGFSPFHEEVQRRMAIGKRVAITEGGRRFSGTTAALNGDGSLKMMLENGDSKTFYSGEVIHKAK